MTGAYLDPGSCGSGIFFLAASRSNKPLPNILIEILAVNLLPRPLIRACSVSEFPKVFQPGITIVPRVAYARLSLSECRRDHILLHCEAIEVSK